MATGRLKTIQPPALPRVVPLVIGLGVLIALFQYVKIPAVEPVICGIDVPVETADVVMLSASWCRYCARARAFFVDAGINYCEYDIEQSERGATLYQQRRSGPIPVIYIGDSVIVGFNRDQITQTLITEDLLAPDHN